METRLKNQHLLWRAGFGPAISQLNEIKTLPAKDLYAALQNASDKKPDYIDVADSYLKDFSAMMEETGKQQKKGETNSEERKLLQIKHRESIKNLNLAWMREMVNSDVQLREKMAFFWHGHFASRSNNIFYQQNLLHIIRSNALESFRDLLHLVSQSAAVLNFLNAAQNRKDHPNENFAREVMELFTLGRGKYTENDVKEAARAFTGWGANRKGEFIFRRLQHDEGTKIIFHKTGNFGGEDVLNMLLDKKETAYFITRKLYRHFVNGRADDDKVKWLASRFYQNNYHISALMRDIFISDWFYEPKNVGTRIKSPIELIVGMQRHLGMEFENKAAPLLLQRVLGQVLFYPPNVAGWPGGKSWIDSSTLMMRLRLPQLISGQDRFTVQPKTDDDQMMGRTDNGDEQAKISSSKKGLEKLGKLFAIKIDWNAYAQKFDHISEKNLPPALAGSLLQTKARFNVDMVERHADNGSRENFIQSATIQLMSTPEYQLC